jgi:beta-fructofuranosidase
MASDRHRPRFHVTAPRHWLNDPNGLCWHGGRWHLHYQHNPHAARWGDIHWGHVSSADLVHWRAEPIAFGPTLPWEAGGCFSGCIAVADDGLATAWYTGASADGQVQCRATSRDLLHWHKDPAPVIATPPAGVSPHDFRDPYLVCHGGWQYLLVGASRGGDAGQVLLYRSRDGQRWEYRHPLFEAPDAAWGAVWECPNLLPLGDRWLLTVSQWPRLGALAFVGRFEDERFVAEREVQLDGDGSAFAHLATPLPDGRALQWAWIDEQRDARQMEAAGWAGALSVPRELWLDAQRRPCSQPAEALAALRQDGIVPEPVTGPGPGQRLRFAGRHLDITLRCTLHTRADAGLTLLAAPDGCESTRIVYRAEARRLVIERARSSLDPGTRRQDQQAVLILDPGEPLELRVLLDGSVLEVFANGRVTLASRVYPQRADSVQAEAFADGPADLSLQVWRMGAIFDPPRDD